MTDKKPKYNFVRLDKNAYAILKRTKARLRKGGRMATFSEVVRHLNYENDMLKQQIDVFKQQITKLSKEVKDDRKESKN
ncbi:MAG: hypothetical protein ACTSRS_22800 [Candidatus Helarchaeota archaeon]